MRTLIISRPDRIGDVVISTSCLAPIREKYPGVTIHFVAADALRPLLEGHPLLAGYIPLSANLAAEFQRLNADAIVHLHPNEACYFAAHQAGVPRRIGYSVRSQNHLLTEVIPDRRAEGQQHEGRYNFDLLASLEVPPPAQLTPQVHLPEGSLGTLQQKLPWPLASTRFAVLHPVAHSKIARWPEENFLRLADRLQTEFNLLPVFIGADPLDCLLALASPHLNLAGKTNLAELGWLLRHAALVVTNDSGPSHLAAAVGSPLVTIFGRSSPMYCPTRWRPLSEKAVVVARPIPRRFFEGRNTHWRRAFAAVTVEDVLEAARKILSGNQSASKE
jgi:ADP-heptose:LPS heptosyltransferase